MELLVTLYYGPLPRHNGHCLWSIGIVRATDRDLEQLSRLNSVVQAVHVNLSPDVFRDDLDSEELLGFWTARLKEPESIVGVALANGIVSGSIWFEIQDSRVTRFIILGGGSTCIISLWTLHVGRKVLGWRY